MDPGMDPSLRTLLGLRQRAHENVCKSSTFQRADARTRTGDPFITSEALYQLSYVGGFPTASLATLRALKGAPGFHSDAPLLGQDRPAFMVAPAPADLQIPGREALAAEPGTAGQGE